MGKASRLYPEFAQEDADHLPAAVLKETGGDRDEEASETGRIRTSRAALSLAIRRPARGGGGGQFRG